MALYGGGECPPSPSSSPSPPPLSPIPTQPPTPKPTNPPSLPPSRFRSRRHNLVRLPSATDQLPPRAEHDDRSAGADGPDGVCVDEPVLLPVVDGADGGERSGREAADDLLGGAEEELDGVAGGAGGEFPVRAVGASGVGGECG